jgi:hypothetical protein
MYAAKQPHIYVNTAAHKLLCAPLHFKLLSLFQVLLLLLLCAAVCCLCRQICCCGVLPVPSALLLTCT